MNDESPEIRFGRLGQNINAFTSPGDHCPKTRMPADYSLPLHPHHPNGRRREQRGSFSSVNRYH